MVNNRSRVLTFRRVLLTQLRGEKYSSHDSTGLFSLLPLVTLVLWGCVSVLFHTETVIKRPPLSASESHSKFVCQHGNFTKKFLPPTKIFPKTLRFSGSHLPPGCVGTACFSLALQCVTLCSRDLRWFEVLALCFVYRDACLLESWHVGLVLLSFYGELRNFKESIHKIVSDLF